MLAYLEAFADLALQRGIGHPELGAFLSQLTNIMVLYRISALAVYK